MAPRVPWRHVTVRQADAGSWWAKAETLSAPGLGRRPPQEPTAQQMRAIRYLLDLEEMSSSISEIEGDGKGVPVLLRQYLKIGGELLAFNVDKNFSEVLDGLVLVDLRKTDPARLETYMGKEGVSRFLEHHGVSVAASR
jgi:hypothetical protein